VDIKRKFIDLGSVMIRRQEYLGKQFLPDSLFTSNIFARDYFLIQEIYHSTHHPAPPSPSLRSPEAEAEKKIQLIHQVLLFHQ
jgi:hypothetical protein